MHAYCLPDEWSADLSWGRTFIFRKGFKPEKTIRRRHATAKIVPATHFIGTEPEEDTNDLHTFGERPPHQLLKAVGHRRATPGGKTMISRPKTLFPKPDMAAEVLRLVVADKQREKLKGIPIDQPL